MNNRMLCIASGSWGERHCTCNDSNGAFTNTPMGTHTPTSFSLKRASSFPDCPNAPLFPWSEFPPSVVAQLSFHCIMTLVLPPALSTILDASHSVLIWNTTCRLIATAASWTIPCPCFGLFCYLLPMETPNSHPAFLISYKTSSESPTLT